ncbi:ATP-dependent protease, partial [Pectobacterium versatile]|nr:ATP-dependent protease [Pectobacterium versatile]
LSIEVPLLPPGILRQQTRIGEDSATVRERVFEARKRQLARIGRINAQMKSDDIACHCRLKSEDAAYLEEVMS